MSKIAETLTSTTALPQKVCQRMCHLQYPNDTADKTVEIWSYSSLIAWFRFNATFNTFLGHNKMTEWRKSTAYF